MSAAEKSPPGWPSWASWTIVKALRRMLSALARTKSILSAPETGAEAVERDMSSSPGCGPMAVNRKP